MTLNWLQPNFAAKLVANQIFQSHVKTCIDWTSFEFRIEDFFEQSATQENHLLCCWPTIHNWILKICPKFHEIHNVKIHYFIFHNHDVRLHCLGNNVRLHCLGNNFKTSSNKQKAKVAAAGGIKLHNTGSALSLQSLYISSVFCLLSFLLLLPKHVGVTMVSLDQPKLLQAHPPLILK